MVDPFDAPSAAIIAGIGTYGDRRPGSADTQAVTVVPWGVGYLQWIKCQIDQIGLGPRLLAIETAIRALIEQASSFDPLLRDRIRIAAEAYLETIPQASELVLGFIERSKACVASIVRRPSA